MLSDSQLAGGLSQIPYLLASVSLQPSLKCHHQVDEEDGEGDLKEEKSICQDLWTTLMSQNVHKL